MDFFSRHLEVSGSSALSSLALSTKPNNVQHELPTNTTLCQTFPLAVSTPLSIPKRLLKEVQQKNVNNLPPKQDQVAVIKSPLDSSASTRKECSNSQPPIATTSDLSCTKATASTSDAQPEKHELQMEMLYESLQTEAQKVQQFKVHAMAQIKQKSDEIILKESQIKNLNEEVTAIKSDNATLVSKLQRQKRMNEDIMSKVAITREMCFALAEEHLELKNLMKLGKTMFAELKEKTSKHSNIAKTASLKIDTYQSLTEQALAEVETTAKTRESEVSKLMEKHALTERNLQQTVEEKNTLCEDLQRDLGNNREELRQLQEQKEAQLKISKQKETELVAAMDELSLKKKDELLALQTKLDATITDSALAEQEHLRAMETSREKLSDALKKLTTTSMELQEEVSKCQQLSEDIAKYEEQVLEMESCVASLEQSKEKLEHDLMMCREELENVRKTLEESSAALAASKASTIELKTNLEQQLEERNNTIENMKVAELKLTDEMNSLEADKQILSDQCNSLEIVNAKMADTLKHYEQELTSKSELLDSARKDMDGLTEKLENSITENKTSNEAADIVVSKLKMDHQKTVEENRSTIATLDQALKLAESKLIEATADHKEFATQSENKLASLEESMTNQKQEYESIIKEKTTAFSKAQDELQRMLDEAVANGKQQVASTEKLMNSRTAKLEATILEKTDAFTRKEADLQRNIEETTKALSEETQRAEDLNQDLQITKDSLEKSLMEKNVMAMALAKETQEKQDFSNRLLAKECEFNKLMSAVQNLKSRWAAVATPLTPAVTPPSVQQAAIKPTSYGTPMKQISSSLPSTPTNRRSLASLTSASATPLKDMNTNNNVTPKPESSLAALSGFNTPRTPNSSQLSDNPKGILRNLGSASKANRVVFSTPIEQKSLLTGPSESDTSALDMEVINQSNRSLQAVSPESQPANLSTSSNSSRKIKRSPLTPTRMAVSSPNQNQNQSHVSDSVSPALSSQSSERLPRSKMLKSCTGKKRLRPAGKKEELGMLTKAMKKHRVLMGHPVNLAKKAIRESDSDCFGFGSE